MVVSDEGRAPQAALRRREAKPREVADLVRRGQTTRLSADGSRITGALCLDCCAKNLRTKALHGDLGEFDATSIYICPKCGSEDLFLEMACGRVV